MLDFTAAKLAKSLAMASISARRLKKELNEILGSEGCPAGLCAYVPPAHALMHYAPQESSC